MLARISPVLLVILFCCLSTQTFSKYSFFVAGHSYGSHSGLNIGLHPPFLKKLSSLSDSSINFLFLTGDIVNKSTNESWMQVANELDDIAIETFYVMGNHDENKIGYDIFNTKHGGTYYSFKYQNELYVVLNSTLQQRSISKDQIEFLTEILDSIDTKIKNVFVFFHEILWNSHEKYKDVMSNSRSRYNQIVTYSNYWNYVHPLLKATGKSVYVIAGDVAGNTDAIPAFYDTWDNVTLIASGMGEVEEENFLKVNVDTDTVKFELIGLNDKIELKPIEYYSLPIKPDTIFGPVLIQSRGDAPLYFINEIDNANSYVWELSEGTFGSSTSNSINLMFDHEIKEGEIKIRAFHKGFGYSLPQILKISIIDKNSSIERIKESNNNKIECYQVGNNLLVKILGKVSVCNRLIMFDLSGRIIKQKRCEVSNEVSKTWFNLNELQSGLYGIEFWDSENRYISKIQIIK